MALAPVPIDELTELTGLVDSDMLPTMRTRPAQFMRLSSLSAYLYGTTALSPLVRTPMQYGGVGNGVANDSTPAVNALAGGYQVAIKRTHALGTSLTVANNELVGEGTLQPIAAGFATNNLITLGAGGRVRNKDLKGTHLPAPSAGWAGIGIPTGCIFYGAGTDAATRISDIVVQGVHLDDVPSGAMFLKFVKNVELRDLWITNTQQTRTDTNADIELYYADQVRISNVFIDTHMSKGLDLDYVHQGLASGIMTRGGSNGFAAIHSYGSSQLVISGWTHDGTTALNGYGQKTWTDDGLVINGFATINADAIQIYGSKHGIVSNGDIQNPNNFGVNVDVQTALADTDVFQLLGMNITRSAGGDTNTNHIAVNIRADTSTANKIGRLRVKDLYIDGGWCGVKSVPASVGLIEYVEIENLTIANLGASGYPIYLGAKNIHVKNIRLLGGITNGMVFHTNVNNRGGSLVIEDIYVGPGLTTGEPVIHAGYPALAEGGWKRINIGRVRGDGNSNASTKLISLYLADTDQCQEVTISDVVGVGYANATPIDITFFPATAQSPVLNLSGISVTNAAGAQGTIAITNGAGVVGGSIRNVSMHITGRPTACVPVSSVVASATGNIAAGATLQVTNWTVPCAVGDRVVVLSNAIIPASLSFIAAANTVCLCLTNTGPSLVNPGTITFRIFIYPGDTH